MPEKWSTRDLAALTEAADARGSDRKWPPVLELPDRGRITVEQAWRRWAKIKRPLIADDDAPKRPRRETPVKERATNVGLTVDGTPQGFRETVANPNASPRAVRCAQKKHLHQHQKAVQSSVALAELRAAARIHRYVKFDNDTQDKN